MRNICNIDFRDLTRNGSYNSACGCNDLLLEINPSKTQLTNYKVEITDTEGMIHTSDVLTATNELIRYEVPIEYWNKQGTMKVRLLSDEGNSDYISFNCLEFDSTNNVYFIYSNGIYSLRIKQDVNYFEKIVSNYAEIVSEKVNGSLEVDGSFITPSVIIPNSYLMKQFLCIGTNNIASSDNDIPNNWLPFKNSLHWINKTGVLVDQPQKYGTLLNMVNNGNTVTQIFIGNDTSHDMYYRSGYYTAWYGTWRKVLDSSNYKDQIEEIHDTGWVTLDEVSGTSTNLKYRKKNGIVTIKCDSFGSWSMAKASGKTWSSIIPKDARPSIELCGSGSSRSTTGYYVQWRVYTDGTFDLYNTNPNSTITYWGVTVTYPAG